jgi:hypothetical protein
MSGPVAACAAGIVALTLVTEAQIATAAQQGGRQRPLAVLEAAEPLTFPSPTDSNSPAFWLLFRGMMRLVVLNSAPHPVLGTGPSLEALETVRPTRFRNQINGARWIESVVPDHGGRLYGYYHNEPAGVCARDPLKTAPRIGAAKSLDGGRSWIDLGLIIEAPPEPPHCDTPNRYFAGGVGDFSVILDQNGYDLFVFFSAYGPALASRASRRPACAGPIATSRRGRSPSGATARGAIRRLLTGRGFTRRPHRSCRCGSRGTTTAASSMRSGGLRCTGTRFWTAT